jgi:hypothetical protein
LTNTVSWIYPGKYTKILFLYICVKWNNASCYLGFSMHY